MHLILDCERMRHAYTGLFEYCERLGLALQLCLNAEDTIAYYIPDKKYEHYFGRKYEHIVRKSLHKMLPVRINKTAVWHTTYQMSNYMKNDDRKIRKVLTIHDLNFLYEKSSLPEIKKCLKTVQANIDRADHIITISEFVKNDILNHLKTDSCISVIYNGCNVLEFPDYNTPSYRPANPFLFSLGTVEPKKNFHVLPCLLKNNDYEWIIAGKENGDYVNKIMEEAKKYGNNDRIKLLGAVSAKDKYWYLKNCTAFLFPSLAEGFGIPPVEAMYFGKPVFLSTGTSLPEIGGEYAYYFSDFDPENMCASFESGMNHYLQAKPEPEVKKWANQFNWENSAKEYRKIYDSLF
jgi:glycosyltransferase involved in cell wall biosynthesis